MFDGSVPIPKTGGSGVPKDVKPHITVIVNITKGDDDDDDVLEIVCSAWPDALDITKLFIRRDNKKLAQPYVGPEFKYAHLSFFFFFYKPLYYWNANQNESK